MKVIFRNFLVTFRRFRLASGLNILGLSVAFAAFIVIMIQVRYERTFDRSYVKTGRIFRVESTLVPAESKLSSKESYTTFCARPLMEMMFPAAPQIESFCVMYGAPSEMYVNYETGDGERRGIMMPFRRVSEGFSDVFSPEMVEGNAACLSEPGKVLLPQSLANRMFGEGPVIDRQILQPDGSFLTVGGVYRDFPENTSIVNDVKIGLGDDFKNDWMDWTLLFFVVLAPEVSSEEAGGQLTNFFNQTGLGQQMGFTEDISFRLNLLEDIYYSYDTSLDIAPKGNRMTTYILLLIAFLVIVIATVNFLNFSTALTPVRIKSIHIQKILGESDAVLRATLILEVVILCVISFLFALCWIYLFDLSGLSSIMLASIDIFQNTEVLVLTFLLAVVVGITGGIYPAVYMTSSRPALVLRGRSGMNPSGRKLRVILTVFQFTISTALIISASFLWLQNRYMQTMEGIMNNDQIATVTLDSRMMSEYSEVLSEELKSDPLIEDVAFSDWPVGFLDYYQYTYTKSTENEDIRYYFLPVSYNFTDLVGLEIIEGRDFEKGDATAQEERLIINELAARQFNIRTGDRLANGSLVIGIIKDFNFMNLRKKIEPMAFTTKCMPGGVLQPTLYVRTAGNAYRAMERIRAGIAKIDPQYPVDVKLYDQQFEETYRKERKTSSQITLFSLLAVIISLMGVFGLVTFETQYRCKEISLRKVMGATVSEILVLFNKKFVLMVVAGFILAAPFAWFGVERGLQSFAYRTPLHGWVFLLSLLIVMIMTCLTVTVQCWRVALINPVNFLKSE